MMQRLRLISGLVMLAYVTMHLLNHAVGLISLDAMENVLWYMFRIWMNRPAQLLLYGSFLVHYGLALYALWQRRTLRLRGSVRRFKLSKDPEFVPKLRQIVGLYVNPPAHAIVLSVDEKSQIQALDRTQPGLPMKKGRTGTLRHDYKRHGTTTLFTALNVLEGKVIGRCMQRHRHQEFILFLNAIEAEIQVGKIIHVVRQLRRAQNIPR